MAKSFAATIDAFARKTQRRAEAVFKESLQRVANEANTPRGQGGLLPLDTSFLQNSLSASIEYPPSGPSNQNEPMGKPDDVVLTIAGAKVTDVIYVGWTAEYAKYMNARYGFRDSAVQNWQQTVNKVTEEAKRRIP